MPKLSNSHWTSCRLHQQCKNILPMYLHCIMLMMHSHLTMHLWFTIHPCHIWPCIARGCPCILNKFDNAFEFAHACICNKTDNVFECAHLFATNLQYIWVWEFCKLWKFYIYWIQLIVNHFLVVGVEYNGETNLKTCTLFLFHGMPNYLIWERDCPTRVIAVATVHDHLPYHLIQARRFHIYCYYSKRSLTVTTAGIEK